MTDSSTSYEYADLPRLPAGFTFGTSTASYQIEGAATEGGKGVSIWDTFAHSEGRIIDGATGDVACDHFHRYVEDVALMKQLGADGYRFSVSWPRVQPTGVGAANEAGLDFYDRLVDELLSAGVNPMVTLYHWDLPQAIEDEGGWLSRDTAEKFGEYAALVGARLGDRVEHWIPINEPNVITMLGYALGQHAPGKALMFDALPVAHHVLLAHGTGAQALRANGAKSIGTANNHSPVWPASQSEGDLASAKLFDDLWNGLYADPMLLGAYPADLAPFLEPVVVDGDMTTIHQPLNFYGVNYYNPTQIAAPGPEDTSGMPFEMPTLTGSPMTDFGWPVVPDGLREWLVGMQGRYADQLPPVYITESGCSYGMGPDAHGVVDDQPRIEYLDAHLRAVGQAITEGVDVRGYYTWSLMDNFEWAEGYTQRFGLVHVDYETLVRTPKRSFEWYAALVAANRQS